MPFWRDGWDPGADFLVSWQGSKKAGLFSVYCSHFEQQWSIEVCIKVRRTQSHSTSWLRAGLELEGGPVWLPIQLFEGRKLRKQEAFHSRLRWPRFPISSRMRKSDSKTSKTSAAIAKRFADEWRLHIRTGAKWWQVLRAQVYVS